MAKVHLMRLAVQDLRTSHIRKRAKRLGRPELWLLYQELLWALHEAGGELSSDPEVLADEVEFFSPAEVAEMLPLLAPGDGKRGGIEVVGDRVRNARVADEVHDAQAFGEEQALRGRRGGFAKARAIRQRTASKRQTKAKPSVSVSVPVSVSVSENGSGADAPPASSPASRENANRELSKASADLEAMASSKGRSPEREEYVREVWAAWCLKRGAELPGASSADLDLARAMYDDGLPLRIVLRGIEDCSKPPRGSRTPFKYAEPAVDEAARHWRRSVSA